MQFKYAAGIIPGSRTDFSQRIYALSYRNEIPYHDFQQQHRGVCP